VTSYVLRRIGQSIFVLIGVTAIVFLILHLQPGGPVRAILGTHNTPERERLLEAQLGLDKPLYHQYFVWLDNLVHFRLGYSYQLNESVSAIVERSLPVSVVLVMLGTLEALLIAVPIGILQAVRHNTKSDHGFSILVLLLYSTPLFLLGFVAIDTFSLRLRIFPVGGIQDPTSTGFDLVSRVDHLILPSLVLAAAQVGVWSRYMRSSMLDVLLQDYMRTARAKGLTHRAAIVGHGLRNALMPIITLVGIALPALFGGAVVIESVFNYPGIGLAFWNAAQSLDFPVLLAIVVVVAVATVLGSLLADILYAVVDPRVRYTR
jgi:peptide/nickel transport system permease protein